MAIFFGVPLIQGLVDKIVEVYNDKKITVNVANANRTSIWCRVARDQIVQVEGDIGGGFNVYKLGVNAHKANKCQFIPGATRGYSQIQCGNTLEFELSTSTDSVYMTVISETGATICKNHTISRTRNYIVDSEGALLEAREGNMWIDRAGRNHVVSAKHIPRTLAYFRPGDHFSQSIELGNRGYKKS